MLRSLYGRTGIIVLVVLSSAGCVSLEDVYLHDAQNNLAAGAAANNLDDARPDELWQTMLNNLTASALVEQNVLAKSAEQRFEGQLTNLENLKWVDLRRCAQGACWSDYQAIGVPGVDIKVPENTQGKLIFLHTKIDKIAKEISQLEFNIRNPVPVESAGPLEITSTLSDTIELAEKKIDAISNQFEEMKENALVRLQTQLDELYAPLIRVFPADQQAMIKEIIDKGLNSVQETLIDTEGILDLQTNLQEIIITDVALEIGPQSNSTQEMFNDAVALISDNVVNLLQLNQLLEPLNTLAVQINAEIKSAESTIGELQEFADITLDSFTSPGQTARAINDIFNKSEHPTLVKIASFEELLKGGITDSIRKKADRLNIGAAFDDVKNTDVSNDFTNALESDSGMSICSQKPCQAKDVINFLKKDKSRIEIIRRAMLAEFRASELAIYNEQLRLIKDELLLTKELAATLQEQLNQQSILAEMVERLITTQGISENLTVFHGLDCLARSAGRTHGNSCAPNTKIARDNFTETLEILAAYFALNGHIKDQEQQQWVSLARHQHRESIAVSKLAARSREQLIVNGLQGLVAFTDGGITSDQIAGIFRLINTSLLGIIAVGQ